MTIRNRIKELRQVPASELLPNPKNWRLHPEHQHNALREILAEIGIADACLARELPDGSLMLIDGHLRAETISTSEVSVLVLDVTEEEADKILLTRDPLAAMAGSDAEKFAELSDAKLPEEGELQNDPEEPKDEDQPSQDDVKVVKIFLSDENIEWFHESREKLEEKYGTEGVSETLTEALRRQHETATSQEPT
jgi:hypothetical protein